MKPVTLGLIVGNRSFFPAHLCKKGRSAVLQALRQAGFKVVALGPDDTRFGSIESMADARQCANLLDAHRHEIDGIANFF